MYPLNSFQTYIPTHNIPQSLKKGKAKKLMNSQRQGEFQSVTKDLKMIQELLAGNNGGGLVRRECPPKLPFTESAPGAAVSSSSTISSSPAPEKLRCPRCDSSNTKFCYYNNYNLTQPRYFCKACRRYWTKGGALRNVPIGGGCRKNKNSFIPTSSAGGGKAKWTSPFLGGFQPETPFSSSSKPPFLFASSQNSNQTPFLSVLRSGQNPNHTNPSPSGVQSTGNEAHTFWRNNNNQFIHSRGEAHHQSMGVLMGNAAAAASSWSSAFSPAIMESAPAVSGLGEFGYWNPSVSAWSDLPTAAGDHDGRLSTQNQV
ncbi:unnamed protein product [Cuscuta epithymum]|uniref:Dof zinc finger protein n=1 Tax=Cuscuta epithymum TaxID=186058 RepID=A0AAV0DL36_9ASTE|nr:unnamed protein product [Cuscuta epithymum]